MEVLAEAPSVLPCRNAGCPVRVGVPLDPAEGCHRITEAYLQELRDLGYTCDNGTIRCNASSYVTCPKRL